MTPAPGTNQRPQEGGHTGRPPPLPARSEKDAFFVPLSALGGPRTPRPPLQRGDPERLALSPHCGPSPAAPGPGLFLGRACGRRGLRGALGAAAGPRSGVEGPHRARTTAPVPGPPRLSSRGSAPQHHSPPPASRPLRALNPPPGPKSSSPAAQPRAPLLCLPRPPRTKSPPAAVPTEPPL